MNRAEIHSDTGEAGFDFKKEADLIVLDRRLCVMTANRSFYRAFRTLPGETEGRLIYELGNRQWDLPDLKKLLEEILLRGTSFHDFDVESDFPSIGRRSMCLNARRIVQKDNETQRILLAIEDVTDRKQMEEMLRDSEVARRLFSSVLVAQEEERRRVAHEIHDGIGQSLSAAKYKIDGLVKSRKSLMIVIPAKAGIQ